MNVSNRLESIKWNIMVGEKKQAYDVKLKNHEPGYLAAHVEPGKFLEFYDGTFPLYQRYEQQQATRQAA